MLFVKYIMDLYDIIMVLDTTASMNFFLESVKKSLPQFMFISKLLGNINDFGVISYKDYCCPNVLEWSGWKKNINDLLPFIDNLKAEGGSDSAECAKTACHTLHKIVKEKTLVFWFTDACPHSNFTQSYPSNISKEKEAIGEDWDWFVVTKKLKEKCTIFPIIYSKSRLVAAYYIHLATITGGICLGTTCNTSDKISRNTIGLFLNICGETCNYDESIVQLFAPKRCFIELFEEEEDFLNNIGNIIIEKNIKPSVLNFGSEKLSVKFNNDKDYKYLVYDVFYHILNAEYVLALSYNPLFGKLWRAICKCREDKERDTLIEKLGNSISILDPVKKKEMESFIECSYNQQDVIDEKISSASDKYPALIYNGNRHFSVKEIMEISRSCNQTIIHQLTEIMTGLEIVNHGNLPQNYIPLSLKSSDILALVPSLVSDGIIFSKRPSLILAILSLRSNVIVLKDIAYKYITNSRGKWLDKEIPENYTFNFVKLVNSYPDALVDEEKEWFSHLQVIGGLQINKLTNIHIHTGYASHKTSRPDNKIECKSCHIDRSFTLLNKNGICGFCIGKENNVIEKIPDKSYWYECRQCKAHYVVVRTEQLNVEPKCHFCRFKEKSPHIQCTKCRNNFVCEYPFYKTMEDWSCPPCKLSTIELIDTIVTTIYQWIRENNLNILDLTLNDIDRFFHCNSIYKGKDLLKKTSVLQSKEITFDRKTVLNLNDIKDEILYWIHRGIAEEGICNFCFTDFDKKHINKTCKNKKCGITACNECLTTWYGQSKAGQIVHLSNLTCPFCKCHPGFNILSKYNREICTLKRFDTESLDHSWYYAWCIDCYCLQKCVEKTCAGNEAPDIKNWRCESCDIKHKTAILGQAPDVNVKKCPGCGVMTEKISGCDHITCNNYVPPNNNNVNNGEGIEDAPLRKCGMHWCWICGEASTYEDIYGHLSRGHGGYGLGDEWGGYDSDGYESNESNY